jgi:hypothetical protein
MIKELLRQNLRNIRGWTSKRKIVVFESDDWGSIRSSSKEGLKYLKNKGIPVEKCHYMTNDSLASEKDLTYLFEVLYSFKDISNNSPIFTANCLMANPDFERIKDSHFNKYYFEKFTDTLRNYPEHGKSFEVWQEGIENRVFFPQLHGREHLNIYRWMEHLQLSEKKPCLVLT